MCNTILNIHILFSITALVFNIRYLFPELKCGNLVMLKFKELSFKVVLCCSHHQHSYNYIQHESELYISRGHQPNNL